MLKLRLMTILILLPCVIWGILALPSSLFEFIVAGVVFLGAWEWSRLSGINNLLLRSVYALCVLFILWAVHYFVIPVLFIFIASLFSWVFAACWVVAFGVSGRAKWLRGCYVKLLLGALMLCPLWFALVILRDSFLGPAWLLFALVIVWSADSSAYIVGRAWGRRALAPKVSPNKTWEGVWAACLMCFVLTAVSIWYFKMPVGQWGGLVGLVLLSTIMSVFGDLFISVLKRQAGLKDTGCIFPGHGGLLDRVDGLLAAIPLFALGSLLLGY